MTNNLPKPKKPCPFCGKVGRVLVARGPDQRPYWHVECNKQHRGRPMNSPEKAIADWDNRVEN